MHPDAAHGSLASYDTSTTTSTPPPHAPLPPCRPSHLLPRRSSDSSPVVVALQVDIQPQQPTKGALDLVDSIVGGVPGVGAVVVVLQKVLLRGGAVARQQ